jgi:hypothetical protein
MDLREIGCGGIDWIPLAQERDNCGDLVNAVLNLRVPCNAGNFFSGCATVNFLIRTRLHGVSK